MEGLGKDTVFTVFPFPSRLKIEELEAERSKLEEQNRSLEMKLEKLTMQVVKFSVAGEHATFRSL